MIRDDENLRQVPVLAVVVCRRLAPDGQGDVETAALEFAVFSGDTKREVACADVCGHLAGEELVFEDGGERIDE